MSVVRAGALGVVPAVRREDVRERLGDDVPGRQCLEGDAAADGLARAAPRARSAVGAGAIAAIDYAAD